MGALLNLIFGWEEICSTPDIKRFYEIRDKLSNSNIESKSDIVNNFSSTRGHNVVFGQNQQAMYYVYVKKQNVSMAKKVVNS